MNLAKRATIVAAIFVGMTLAACQAADAGPRWRLRRWSNRAPIDPTIRATVSFRGPTYRWPANPNRYRSPARVRVVYR